MTGARFMRRLEAAGTLPNEAEVRLRHAQRMAASHHCLMRTAAHNWRRYRAVARDPMGLGKERAKAGQCAALKDAILHRIAMLDARAEAKRLESLK
jgi:hypothetical protein